MPDKKTQAAPDVLPADSELFDDMKPTAGADAPMQTINTPGQMLSATGSMIGDIGKGALKGALHTISSSDQFARDHLPAFLTNSNMGFGKPADLQNVQRMATPNNTAQKIGYGGEQVGEFLAPAGLEKALVGKAVELAPKAAPLARVLTGALSSGAVNKAQGGSFTGGAVTGGVAGGIGEGLRSVAPKLAESAIGITKGDRAFGKTPGQSILEETRGIRPTTIAESGQRRLNTLTPELESRVDAASVRANRLRGLLAAPAEETPLHRAPDIEGTISRPTVLTQADRPMRAALPAPSLDTPMSAHTTIFPDQLPGGTTGIRATYPNESPGLGASQYIGSIGGDRGGQGQIQGVLRRPAPVGGAPVPSVLPNHTASLADARSVVNQSLNTAGQQEASSLHSQLGELRDFLHRGAVSGQEIPENVTPRRLLDLKRGFSKEFLGRWNPETHGDTIATGRRAYGALDSELDRTVPDAAGLNQRISSLIPVVHRADSTARNAPITQKVVGRFLAPTGALTLAGIGAAEGSAHGLGGAIAGGVSGLVGPLVAGTPEGQMLAARLFHSPATARGLRAVSVPATEKLLDWIKTQKTGTGGQGQ